MYLLLPCSQVGCMASKPSANTATAPTSSSVAQTVQLTFQRQAYAPTYKYTEDLTAALSYVHAKDMMPFQIVVLHIWFVLYVVIYCYFNNAATNNCIVLVLLYVLAK